jgi:hypothetical protein
MIVSKLSFKASAFRRPAGRVRAWLLAAVRIKPMSPATLHSPLLLIATRQWPSLATARR